MQKLEEELKAIEGKQKAKEDAEHSHLASIIKTVLVLWFLTIALFVGAIVWYFNQYDIEVVEEISEISSEQGNANYIKGEGNEINNG